MTCQAKPLNRTYRIKIFYGRLWFKKIVGLGLCFKDQHEALLTLRLNYHPTEALKKQKRVQDQKRLRVKNVLPNPHHLSGDHWRGTGAVPDDHCVV